MQSLIHSESRPSQTKIIATLGPASSPKDVLRQMFIEGIDVCRLNFSHSRHEDHLKDIITIHELNAELKTSVAILADLQGPKLRIGDVKDNKVELVEGAMLEFTNEKCMGDANRVYMSYTQFAQDVKIGEFILIDDGKLKLQVVETNKKDIVKAKVIAGGTLSSKKGVNLPNTIVSQPSLTEKDIEDAIFAMSHKVDWLALSFVRSAQDIKDLRILIEEHNSHAGIIAKIEKPEAIKDIDKIIDATDAIMIARGDLGVEIPFEKVPMIQREIINKCIKKGTPVIIATQMMESQITNFNPTRAEATDVATAVVELCDAVMLSGETSVGKYPVRVIKNMQKIINHTESFEIGFYRENILIEQNESFFPDSLCNSAAMLAKATKAKAIIAFTGIGYAGFRLSSHRTKCPIFVFTPNDTIIRRMSLLWGVRVFPMYENLCFEDSIKYTNNYLKELKILNDGDIVIHLGATPLNITNKANTIRLSYV